MNANLLPRSRVLFVGWEIFVSLMMLSHRSKRWVHALDLFIKPFLEQIFVNRPVYIFVMVLVLLGGMRRVLIAPPMVVKLRLASAGLPY